METLLKKQKSDADDQSDDAHEMDAYKIGIAETYHRLWAVVKLPAVQSLILILLTYRLPCALSDNIKFLKAVEFGLSKQTTPLQSHTIMLPLGIAVPIIATKIWHGHPLKQFMWAYKFRATFVTLVHVLMLLATRSFLGASGLILGGEGYASWERGCSTLRNCPMMRGEHTLARTKMAKRKCKNTNRVASMSNERFFRG